MIKKTLITMGVCLCAVSSAYAQEPIIKDHYKEVINQKPYHVEVCKDVSVSGDKSGYVKRCYHWWYYRKQCR